MFHYAVGAHGLLGSSFYELPRGGGEISWQPFREKPQCPAPWMNSSGAPLRMTGGWCCYVAGGLAQTPGCRSLRCPGGTGLCCALGPVDPCGAGTGHSRSNTASLTTANPQANSPARAGPGYWASIQNDLNNCASLRGAAVPALITGGTPVPQFMPLCIVQFLSALLSGVDFEGVKTPIPEQSLMPVVWRAPRNHEMSFRALTAFWLPMIGRKMTQARPNGFIEYKGHTRHLSAERSEESCSASGRPPPKGQGEIPRGVYPEAAERDPSLRPG